MERPCGCLPEQGLCAAIVSTGPDRPANGLIFTIVALVFRDTGLQDVLVSDSGKSFTSAFWTVYTTELHAALSASLILG
jgi:hypothetical protein